MTVLVRAADNAREFPQCQIFRIPLPLAYPRIPGCNVSSKPMCTVSKPGWHLGRCPVGSSVSPSILYPMPTTSLVTARLSMTVVDLCCDVVLCIPIPFLSYAHRIPLDIHSRAPAGVFVVCCLVFRSVVFSFHALPMFMISLWVLGFADAWFEPGAIRMVRAVAVSGLCQARWVALFLRATVVYWIKPFYHRHSYPAK